MKKTTAELFEAIMEQNKTLADIKAICTATHNALVLSQHEQSLIDNKAESKKSSKAITKKSATTKTAEKKTSDKEYEDTFAAIERINSTTVAVHICEADWTECQNFKRRGVLNKAINQYLKSTYGAKGNKEYQMEMSAGSVKELFSKADSHFKSGKSGVGHFVFTPAEISVLLDAKWSSKEATRQAKAAKQW